MYDAHAVREPDCDCGEHTVNELNPFKTRVYYEITFRLTQLPAIAAKRWV